MDPDAVLAELTVELGRHDWNRVEEVTQGLLDWLQRRGVPPRTVGPNSLGTEWHRAIATFVCHAALSKVRDARRRRRVKDSRGTNQ